MNNNSLSAVKKRIFDIIQIGNRSDIPSRAFDIFLVAAIILNVAVMFLQTFDSMAPYDNILGTIEFLTLAVFCVEYGLRIWTAEYLFPSRPKHEAVVRFLFSFDGIVELLTILPFYYLSGFVVFRMLRVVRIFHLFRINPNTDSFNVIIAVLAEKKNQILSSVFIVIILMLAASLCMYSVEHDAQPDVFENAFSGVWWSVSALLTVGYGDIYPVTVLGKLMAIVISFLGVGAVAIPTGIISAGFVEHYTKAANAENALEVSMQTVVIDIDSLWLGKTVEQIESHYAVQIVLIKRDDTTYVPKGTTVIEMKDMLVVYRKNKGSQTRDTHLV